MNIFKRLFNISTDKSIQAEKSCQPSPSASDRNRVLLQCLRTLEFGAVEIRQALVGLNGVRVKELAKMDGVSAVTIYNTIKGRRTSPRAQELIAQALGLSVEELFPGGTDKVYPPQAGGLFVRGSEGQEPQARTPGAPDRKP